MLLHNNGAAGFGGMLTFLTITPQAPGPDTVGPTAGALTLSPNPTNGTTDVLLTASISDVASGGSVVTAAEYFIDAAGTAGTGLPLAATDLAFDSPLESVQATITVADLALLTSGQHAIYVHGQDANGNWGATATTILVVDKTRPAVSGLNVSPNPTGGAAIVTLTGSAADAASNIVAAEWFRGTDPGPGRGTAMSATDGAFDSLSEALTASINVSGWAAGNHTLYVRAKDAAGNWSLTANVVVTVQPPDLIFADSFESGTFGAWAAATGPISVTGASAMVGTFGMQAALSGNTPGFVTDNAPANEPTYHARFYFNPHGTLTGNTQQDIFAGLNTAGTRIFRLVRCILASTKLAPRTFASCNHGSAYLGGYNRTVGLLPPGAPPTPTSALESGVANGYAGRDCLW